MYRVRQVGNDVDLAGFSRWLWEQGVDHRITAEGERQVLWLANPELAGPVSQALERFLGDPELQRATNKASREGGYMIGRWQPSPGHAPVVLGIIIFAVLMAWVTAMGRSPLAYLLMMVDPQAYSLSTLEMRLDALADTLGSGQLWRLLTPDFLHFSWMHIIFNSVLLWFLGSQVEWFDGWPRFLVLFVVTSLLSNSLQYLVSGPLFGGLSGVVYGLLGYCWLSQMKVPRFQFPPALVTFAVVWMLIGFTPVPELVGLGRMANEAHLGGFIAGLLLAAVLPPIKKPRRAGH